MSRHRGEMTEKSLRIVLWLLQRDTEFTAVEFARAAGINDKSSTYRWLNTLEKIHLITAGLGLSEDGIRCMAWRMNKSAIGKILKIYCPKCAREI